MPDAAIGHQQSAPPFWRDTVNRRWLISSGILAIGLVLGGYLLGDGLTRRFRLPLLQTAMYHTSGNAILFCILTRIIPNVPDILPSR